MNEEQILKLEKSIQNMKDKLSKIYLIVQDTKGNAKASISYIYKLATALKNGGFNPIILHEKADYINPKDWMADESIQDIEHMSIENTKLEISPEDFIIIPELYGFIMSQISKLPCGKIVLSQSYDYIFETLQPGQSWSQMGFFKCITTSEGQKEYLESIMKNVSFDILPPYISDFFKKQTKPANPIIAIHSRDQRDSVNIIKSFYVKFPQYRWVTFRDMRNLSESEFASTFNNCFLSVWIDEISSYGTFPLESMKCDVPVLGLVPNLIPEWMNDNNGIWITNKIQIVDYIADFLQNWLEDSVSENLHDEMEKTISSLQTKENFDSKVIELFTGYLSTRITSFEDQLSKLKPTE